MKPELLSPAGNLEKLQAAVRFGADAVYVGAGPYSLRTHQSAFSIQDLKTGIEFAHQHNVKLYLAMNIFAFDDDFAGMVEYLEQAVPLGIDAIIISDPGLLALVHKKYPQLKIHLSTQANTLNAEAVRFWQAQGVKRIVLGRELNLAQVKKIKEAVPSMEIELFVHGAMCMSFSGRCLLSKFMTDRSANRGECSHPCRWQYQMKEKERPDEEFTIEEDQRGTYVMNSKDLCMIEHIPELIEAGVDSFKIEGRMKSVYYVALVTKVYREVIEGKRSVVEGKRELENVSHRHYCTGFYLGEDDRENQGEDATIRNYTFVGVVENHDVEKGELEIKARNYFKVGDELEVIDPSVKEIRKFKVEKVLRSCSPAVLQSITEVHNQHHVIVPVSGLKEVSSNSLLRRIA